jgi:hypothetical protein
VMNFMMESEGEAQRLTSMLSRFRETTPSQPLVEDITDDEPITRSSSSKYSSALPTVRRAADRILTCDSLAQLHAITAPPPPTPPPPLQLLNPIKLNTRLNGKHRGNWKMSKSDNFLKVIFLISFSLSVYLSLDLSVSPLQLKEAIRTKYGFDYLSPDQIKLASCDGTLANNDNPGDADLEEDDLIDVTVKVGPPDWTSYYRLS